MAGKQAKVLSETQIKTMLACLNGTRHQLRNRATVLLSLRAGLRAKGIALPTRSMVTNSDGSVGDVIYLEDRAAKRRSGRSIPMNLQLRDALVELHSARQPASAHAVIYSDRGKSMSAGSVTVWFGAIYTRLGFRGCSSHSGRRTFVTHATR